MWVKCKKCGSEKGRKWISWIVHEERIYIYNCCIQCSEKEINEMIERRKHEK